MPSIPPNPSPTRRRNDTGRVRLALDEICASLGAGAVIPSHPELMRRFDASERAVRSALDDLRREGKIVRRQGAGTFVAERPSERTPVVPPGMTDQKTVVAIVRPDESFFDEAVRRLYRHVEAAGLTLLCRVVNPEWSALPEPIPDANTSVGYVVFRYDLAPLARQLLNAGSRVALVGVPPAEVIPEVPCVYGDHEYGGWLAAKHLLDLGHRRIAYAHSGAGLQETLRWRGHLRALHEAQRTGEVSCGRLTAVHLAAWTARPELAAAYFGQPGAPTGIAAWNDHEAASLLGILARAGVRVPHEVSVIGYDALPAGELVYPPLTTVDHGLEQQLQAALNLLTRPVAPPPSHSVVILPTLVRRESTAPPRKD